MDGSRSGKKGSMLNRSKYVENQGMFLMIPLNHGWKGFLGLLMVIKKKTFGTWTKLVFFGKPFLTVVLGGEAKIEKVAKRVNNELP